MFISDEAKYFLFVRFLECPALRQECLVENVSVIGCEAYSLNDLAYQFERDGLERSLIELIATTYQGQCIDSHWKVQFLR